MTEIYYVEDDPDIAAGVKAYLENRACKVTVLGSVFEAKQALGKRQPSLVLVDWNLPDGDGSLLCGWIRRRFGEKLPVLFLTVRGDTKDVVQGFQNGADDYLVKPFEPEILYSRILAVLRRSGGREAAKELFCDEIRLDRERVLVWQGERKVALSPTEYRVLCYLMERKGKTVSRESLLEALWDSEGNFVNDNTLTVAMKRIREKLGSPPCIKTVRSFGYRMEDTKW